MSRKVIPTFPFVCSAQLVGQLLPRCPDSWKLQSREGQGGSCHGHHCGGTEGRVLTGGGKGNPRVFPISWPWPCPGCLQGFVRHPGEKTARCARAAALVTAPESHSPLSGVCFWGSVAFRKAFVHKDNESCSDLPEC